MKTYPVFWWKIEPVMVCPRSMPCHLHDGVADSLEHIIKHGVIEEHPSNYLAPWMSYVCSDCHKRWRLPACDFGFA